MNKKMPAGAQAHTADTNQQLNYNPQLRLLSILIEGKKAGRNWHAVWA